MSKQLSKHGLVARVGQALAGMRQRARERRELGGMTGSDLHDIGISRTDVPRVFGPAFAREYANRGEARRAR